MRAADSLARGGVPGSENSIVLGKNREQIKTVMVGKPAVAVLCSRTSMTIAQILVYGAKGGGGGFQKSGGRDAFKTSREFFAPQL